MNNNHMVTVAVCTYNRADSLADTLQCLRGQSVPDDVQVELLVVDNNSKDHTRATVEQFSDHPLNLRYLFEPAQGLSHARNCALAAARGEVIVFTDDDVLPQPDWLAHLVALFVEDPQIGVAGGKILPHWTDRQPRWVTPELYPYLALLDYGDSPQVLDDRPVWGANIAFRTDCLRAVGGFDTGVGRTGKKLYAGEETAVIRAIRDTGHKVVYEPRSVVLHKMQADRLTRRYFLRWVWDNGELDAAAEPAGDGRRLFGVPIYHFRLLLRQLLALAKASSERRFHRLMLTVRELSHIWHMFGSSPRKQDG